MNMHDKTPPCGNRSKNLPGWLKNDHTDFAFVLHGNGFQYKMSLKNQTKSILRGV